MLHRSDALKTTKLFLDIFYLKSVQDIFNFFIALTNQTIPRLPPTIWAVAPYGGLTSYHKNYQSVKRFFFWIWDFFFFDNGGDDDDVVDDNDVVVDDDDFGTRITENRNNVAR